MRATLFVYRENIFHTTPPLPGSSSSTSWSGPKITHLFIAAFTSEIKARHLSLSVINFHTRLWWSCCADDLSALFPMMWWLRLWRNRLLSPHPQFYSLPTAKAVKVTPVVEKVCAQREPEYSWPLNICSVCMCGEDSDREYTLINECVCAHLRAYEWVSDSMNMSDNKWVNSFFWGGGLANAEAHFVKRC